MKKILQLMCQFWFRQKRLVSPKAIPKVVEQNVETVVDWLNWLENVGDENLKKEVDPAVTKLKKEIDEL